MQAMTVTGKSTVVGLGFRASASVESLRSALQIAMAASQSATDAPLVLTALATAEDKAHHPAFTRLADEMALPVVAVPLAKLTELARRLEARSATPHVTPHAVTLSKPSNHVPQRYGARSLAESSALSAAGPGTHLLAPRAVSTDHLATAAIAATAATADNTHP